MADFRLLLDLELRGMLGWNRFRHSRDPKERRRWLLIAVVWAFLAAMVAFYMGGLAYGLVTMGLASILPAYLTVICSVLILVFGLFRTGSLLFSQKGYDLLRALPVRPRAIVLSRLATLYLEDAALTLLLMAPAVVVCAVLTGPGLWFYLTMVPAVLLVPLLPLVAATAFGVAVSALASRMRCRSLATTLLSLVLCLVMLAGSFALGSAGEALTPEMLADLAGAVGGALGRFYPPALWLQKAAGGSLRHLLLFVALSLAAAVALVAVVSRYFDGILRRLQATSARKDYRLGTLEHRSLMAALYRRELRRYFASSVYVTNTIIGPILAVGLAAALLAAGTDVLGPLPIDITPLLPLVLTATLIMMPPAAVSVSMEGRRIWQICCLPVPMKGWLDSKLALTLTFTLPAWLISQILLTVALEPALSDGLWQWLLSLSLVVFGAVFGLTADLKLHRFDWQREEQPVKQGAAAMVGGLCNPLAALLCGAAILFCPPHLANLLKAGLTLTVLLVTLLLYRHNNWADFAKL